MDLDSESDTDNHVGSISSASSVSSYNVSTRPASVISIDSTMQLLKHEFGRDFNNYSAVYSLPADEEEMSRLELQHQLLAEIIGERYPSSLVEVLSTTNETSSKKRCLDLGCGTGSWLTEVALDFPDVEAVGVDLVPMQSEDIPLNVRSEVDDINLGLQHFYEGFDVAHTRLIAAGICDYHRVIDQLAHVVRPGGLIDISEFDFHVYDANHRRLCFNDDRSFSEPWFGQWMHLLRSTVKAKGADVDAATHLYDWVAKNPLFENLTYREHWLPTVPKARVGVHTVQMLQRDASMRSNLTAFLRSGHPLLLGSGIPEPLVAMMETKVAQEIDEREAIQFTRLQCVTARKRKPRSASP